MACLSGMDIELYVRITQHAADELKTRKGSRIMRNHSFKIGLMAMALGLAPLASQAADTSYDYYDYYDAGYFSDAGYDDDWFYDYYDYNDSYDYYDADWFDWEEDGLFE